MGDKHRLKRCVVHTGNILNNGYLHCKYLRAAGVAADSLNVDYRHCQGQPEWVEVDIQDKVDEFNPDWGKVDLGGYRRPDWFFDVPSADLTLLGKALEEGSSLSGFHGVSSESKFKLLFNKAGKITAAALRKHMPSASTRFLRAANNTVAQLPTVSEEEIQRAAAPLKEEFKRYYPDRPLQLTDNDVRDWASKSKAYAAVLKNYQLAHSYALDPIYPLVGLPGKPFIAYEHGTLRDFPYEDSSRGRLYALAVQKAEKVIITNADCNLSAERLGLKNYIFVPHIIDDNLLKPEPTPLREKLLKEHQAELIFVAPSRHHWKNCPPGMENSWFKRNDILIRGLGRLFKARPELKLLVVFFEWGQEVPLSKQLIADCGFSDRVRWEPIQSKPAMKHFYNAADVILDQFNAGIGTFGAVVPESFACAKPVILNYKTELHHWCYPELPPAINAADEQAVEKELARLIDDREYRLETGAAGRRWFDKYHSSKVVISRIMDIYDEIADKRGWGRDFCKL